MKQLGRVFVSVIAASLAAATTGNANAQVAAPKTSLMGLVEDGHRFVQAAMAGNAPSSPKTPAQGEETAEPPPAAKTPFDFAPRASVVARDWRGSLRVAGRTTVLDDVRPSASNRTVLLRLAWGTQLAPFAQVGAGMWRIDPVLFPSLPHHEAVAGQLGAGFELHGPRGFELAGEAQYTLLYREGPVAIDDPAPRIFAFLLAAKTSW